MSLELEGLHWPTPFGLRGVDAQGDGSYGAPRGARRHRGLDVRTCPGQLVVPALAPALVVRTARPYTEPKAEGLNTGVLLKGLGPVAGWWCKMFYVHPLADVMGETLEPGDWLGVAARMRLVYEGITPHVHVQLYRGTLESIVDPTPYLVRPAA